MNTFREDLAICPQCAVEDFEKLGVAYIRRQHQIRVQAICARHQTILEERCNRCSARVVKCGIPRLRCENCSSRIVPRSAQELFDEATVEAFGRINRLTISIFRGEVRGPFNLDNVVSAKSNAVREKSIGSMGLSNRIRATFGLDWLTQTHLNPYQAPTYGWPGIYVNRAWGTCDPSMELLLAASLDDSRPVRDYWHSRRRPYPTRLQAGLPYLDGVTIKQFLRGMLPDAIANSNALPVQVIRSSVSAFPDLRRRHLMMRKRATADRHKAAILSFIRDHPNCAITDIRRAYPAAQNYLKKNHREWWEREVGHRSAFGTPRKDGVRPKRTLQARMA
jgi:hypothetical protein